MIRAGAALDVQGKYDGRTALQLAREVGHTETAVLLGMAKEVKQRERGAMPMTTPSAMAVGGRMLLVGDRVRKTKRKGAGKRGTVTSPKRGTVTQIDPVGKIKFRSDSGSDFNFQSANNFEIDP